jgi:hypothetical protein
VLSRGSATCVSSLQSPLTCCVLLLCLCCCCQDDDHAYIVSELCAGGDLKSLLEVRGGGTTHVGCLGSRASLSACCLTTQAASHSHVARDDWAVQLPKSCSSRCKVFPPAFSA